MCKLLIKFFRFVQVLIAIIAFAGLGWFVHFTVYYLRTAPLFEVQKLAVSGLKRVEESQVLAKAGFGVGTNVFMVDLDRIRESVEQLPWVRHALVKRVLPDQIVIQVVEREPIGLARIRGEVYQFDVDAMILDLDSMGETIFPILNGLRQDDMIGNRLKVDSYRTVLSQLGETELSEVHINDSGEVSVVSSSDPLMVHLGTGEFRDRWIKYLQLKAQIQQQYPQAVFVDLRFRNQVIVKMKGDDTGEMILWGVEKKTL